MSSDRFIFGKEPLTRIVSAAVRNDTLHLWTLGRDGSTNHLQQPYSQWYLSDHAMPGSVRLEGELPYKYMNFGRPFDAKRLGHHVTWNQVEAAAQLYGFTYYKDTKLEEVPALFFDIETTGLVHGADSKVLLISNTYRCGPNTERRLFKYSDYGSQAELLAAWCQWVRDINPSIMAGYNLYGFDFPYMAYCAGSSGLRLGRDGSSAYFSDYQSKYRKDGSQDLYYNNISIHGREVVDVMFLAYKYDQASRKYPDMRLKTIVAFEGLEVTGRQHYDASQIRHRYLDPTEWSAICRYAEHDADDAASLFYLMAPALFYLARSVPMSFQEMVNRATGKMLNSFLLRSYLQDGHSVPRATEYASYQGAISFGNPGIYKHVKKVDVAGLYPSIILQEQISDTTKDPRGHFLAMVEAFSSERLANKKRAKETGDRYYRDLEQSQKVASNSAYGLLGTSGLNFNSIHCADKITEHGRRILNQAIDFATARGFRIVNADTDSISITDSQPWTTERRAEFLAALNALYPARIRWEDDGVYPRLVVVAAKNYVLDDGTTVKVKGASLKASNKEVALREFIQRSITLLLDDNRAAILPLYHEYVREICQLSDIKRWASKRSITSAVLESDRPNEARVRAAIAGTEYVQGDKVYLYFNEDDLPQLAEHWDGNHSRARLLGKLHDTVQIFDSLLNTKAFPNYTLKRSQPALSALLLAA